jgi:DNA repair protein RadD
MSVENISEEKQSFQGYEASIADGVNFLKEVIAWAENKEECNKNGMKKHLERLRLFYNLLLTLNLNLNSKLTLRSNQVRAIESLIDFMRNAGEGEHLGYFRQPTGAGKTILMKIIYELFDKKTLILVPNLVLLEQTKKVFMKLGIREEEIGLYGGGNFEEGRKLTVCTYASLNKVSADNFEVILCDEAHRGLGKKTQEHLEAVHTKEEKEANEEEIEYEEGVSDFDEQKFPAALVLGFTASPRLRGKGVDDSFGKLIDEASYVELVESGFLKRIELLHAEGCVYEADMEKGYVTVEEEEVILEREKSFEKLLDEYENLLLERSEKLRTAVYCPTVSACEKFKLLAEARGFKAVIYTSKLKEMELEKIERGLDRGEIDMIVSCEQLNEGWDYRPLNCIVLARATLSPARVIQPVGRGLRAVEGEQNLLYVIETNWNLMRGSDSRYAEKREKEEGEEKEKKDNAEQMDNAVEIEKKGVVVGGTRPLGVVQVFYEMGEDVKGFVGIYGKEGELEIVDAEEIEKEELIKAIKAKVPSAKDWKGMKRTEKEAFKIEGIGALKVIARKLGIEKGNPIDNSKVHDELGRVIYGEEVYDGLEEEEVKQLIAAIKAKVPSAKTWKGMNKTEKGDFKIEGVGALNAIARELGIEKGNPINNSTVHDELGRVIYGKEVYDES